jgi:hypothetical protein
MAVVLKKVKVVLTGGKHYVTKGGKVVALKVGDVTELTERALANLRDKFRRVDEVPATPPAPPKPELRTDGPTIEVYVAAGYDPKGYPPEGFAEVDSPGLVRFKATGSVEEKTEPVPVPATPAEPPTGNE